MKEQHVLDNENLLKILPFYNVLIYFMKQSKIKKLTNAELLNELPFYSGLNAKEIAFKRYAKSYNIEIVKKKDPMVQLYLSKLCIKDLFKVLLYEMKGFKYQITLHVALKNNKLKDKAKYTEYARVYLNSFVKIVINENFELDIDKSFDWINEGSGWIIELINSQYLNISTHVPLLGNGDYIKLSKELNNPKKGLINICNNDNKCFLWCHIRHLNPISDHSTRIKKEDKRIADTLNYANINFPVSAKDYGKIEDQNDICIKVFSYEDKVVCPIYISKKVFDNCMNVLMIHEGNKSHYVYIKDFNRLMFNKTKNGNKKWFCMSCLQYFGSENVLDKLKENCLVINGEQRVKLNEGFISFKNYSRQMRVPFKMYADFECILKKNKKYDENGNSDSSWSVKMQDHVPCGFRYKVVCVDDKFTKDIVTYRGKDCVDKFVDAILSEYEYCKSVMRDHFNKNLVMSMEEEVFQKANKCCICGKLFELIDEKVRDHCHISSIFRGAAHFSCNANFKIKKVPAVFHNLKGYDGHLIMRGLSNFNVVIDVIPCGLENYMAIIEI